MSTSVTLLYVHGVSTMYILGVSITLKELIKSIDLNLFISTKRS